MKKNTKKHAGYGTKNLEKLESGSLEGYLQYFLPQQPVFFGLFNLFCTQAVCWVSVFFLRLPTCASGVFSTPPGSKR